MSKFLITIILFLAIFLLILQKNDKKNEFHKNGDAIESLEIINEINNNLINFNKVYSDLQIKQGLFSIKGFVAYEKPNNFRMICDSIISKELEIGSNNDYFWFYLRSMKPKALYYCPLNSVEKTRLRKIFYPDLLKSFLGITEIKGRLFKSNYYYVEQKVKIGSDEYSRITIIDNNKITGYRFYKENQILLEVDILDFQKIEKAYLPIKIRINWIEENIKQEWTLSNIKINSNYNQWQMPEYKNRINLIDY